MKEYMARTSPEVIKEINKYVLCYSYLIVNF